MRSYQRILVFGSLCNGDSLMVIKVITVKTECQCSRPSCKSRISSSSLSVCITHFPAAYSSGWMMASNAFKRCVVSWLAINHALAGPSAFLSTGVEHGRCSGVFVDQRSFTKKLCWMLTLWPCWCHAPDTFKHPEFVSNMKYWDSDLHPFTFGLLPRLFGGWSRALAIFVDSMIFLCAFIL